MAQPQAQVIRTEGQNPQVMVTNKNGSSELYSMEEAQALNTAVKQALDTVNNDAGAQRTREEQVKADEEAAKQRLEDIKEANKKADADREKNQKKEEEAQARAQRVSPTNTGAPSTSMTPQSSGEGEEKQGEQDRKHARDSRR